MKHIKKNIGGRADPPPTIQCSAGTRRGTVPVYAVGTHLLAAETVSAHLRICEKSRSEVKTCLKQH